MLTLIEQTALSSLTSSPSAPQGLILPPTHRLDNGLCPGARLLTSVRSEALLLTSEPSDQTFTLLHYCTTLQHGKAPARTPPTPPLCSWKSSMPSNKPHIVKETRSPSKHPCAVLLLPIMINDVLSPGVRSLTQLCVCCLAAL